MKRKSDLAHQYFIFFSHQFATENGFRIADLCDGIVGVCAAKLRVRDINSLVSNNFSTTATHHLFNVAFSARSTQKMNKCRLNDLWRSLDWTLSL